MAGPVPLSRTTSSARVPELWTFGQRLSRYMQATLKTRKPVDKLTAGDLVAFPIWEFASDEEDVEGQDETWVRPVGRKQVPAGAYSQLVASDFTTACGVKLQGFMTVTTANEIEISAGAIVGDGFYCVLPGMSDDRA